MKRVEPPRRQECQTREFCFLISKRPKIVPPMRGPRDRGPDLRKSPNRRPRPKIHPQAKRTNLGLFHSRSVGVSPTCHFTFIVHGGPQPNNYTDDPCDTQRVTAPSVGLVAKVNGEWFSVRLFHSHFQASLSRRFLWDLELFLRHPPQNFNQLLRCGDWHPRDMLYLSEINVAVRGLAPETSPISNGDSP